MIRLAKIEEIDRIVDICKRCGLFLRQNGIDQWDENYPKREIIQQDVETETLFVYADNENLKGLVVLNETQDDEYNEIDWLTKDSSRNLVVHRLAVHPDYQGQGIAQKLMDYAEVYAEKLNYDSIRLDTFSQNQRNQTFYQRRNYTELGTVYLKYKKAYPYYCYEKLIG